MNGFTERGLDESVFSEPSSTNGLQSFDAFPKTKATYTRRTVGGGYATVVLLAVCSLLSVYELRDYVGGRETQTFSVEKGVSHTLQINLDAVVAMRCGDLHINVQDASGDRILAGDMLEREPTGWALWAEGKPGARLAAERERMATKRVSEMEADTHVGHVLGEVRRGRRRFAKGPALARDMEADACRVFGSLEGNKVQGDFHITARGHGYMEYGEHLSHESFNFSHIITELSFGPLYPSLLNPLDRTLASTEDNFNRFQYYLSIVPTIYTRAARPRLPTASSDPTALARLAARSGGDTIITNQYAVTSSSRPVPSDHVPGIFFKFDIEPILLTISERRGGLLALLVRVVNVVSGVLVGGGWIYQLAGWGKEQWTGEAGRRRRARSTVGEGMLHGRKDEEDEGIHDE